MIPERDQLSPREIADRVGLSYRAILRAIKRGDLVACEPVPGRLRVEVSEYERWRLNPAQKPAQSLRESVAAQRITRRSGPPFADLLRAIEQEREVAG